jgi:hypothetical protein
VELDAFERRGEEWQVSDEGREKNEKKKNFNTGPGESDQRIEKSFSESAHVI